VVAATQTTSLERIASCGVVGAGGGGFPTHLKLGARADTIILNAAECEPLLHKDKELLKHFGEQVLAGLEAARRLVGATDAVVGIKGKYADVADQLRPALYPGMRIFPLHDSYPAGDEFILVHDVTGRIIPPGKLPLAVGCVVINVEMALNIAQGEPVTVKYLTVAGAVHTPVTIGVPVGTSFADAVALAGGATTPDPVVLVGGAMMGRYAGSLAEPITKTTGGLIILDRSHPLVARYTRPWKAAKALTAGCCDQCTFCTALCPRYLLGHPVEPHQAIRALGFNMVGEPLVLGALYCCECNLCTMMACPEDLDPKEVMVQSKRRLLAEGRKWEVAADPERARLHMNDRRMPVSRLIRKLGLSGFRNEGPLLQSQFRPARVVLPLKQHAGPPAGAVVRTGDRVRVGDVIGRPAHRQIGSVIHASIEGTVRQVSEQAIVIEA
jgi:Na+-translocating ferredoxin:NAD+ oxidoreductase RnfC subunit